jgi:hypothetical protein
MINLANAGFRYSGPKILSDLASKNEWLAQGSTKRALMPKGRHGVQPLCLEMHLKTKTLQKD